MGDKDDPTAAELLTPKRPPSPFSALGNPIVFIAVSILLSVFVLIGSAIFGFDRGVLIGMSRIDFARGLITYLFAIVTIGTAVVLVVSGLTGIDDVHNDRRFQRGKEILSLLLGIFGTIVGFYFGSEINRPPEGTLQVASLRVSRVDASPTAKFSVTTFVTGGRLPYEYAVTLGDAIPKSFEPVPETGWINAEVDASAAAAEKSIQIAVVVRDVSGHSSRQAAILLNQPSPK